MLRKADDSADERDEKVGLIIHVLCSLHLGRLAAGRGVRTVKTTTMTQQKREPNTTGKLRLNLQNTK